MIRKIMALDWRSIKQYRLRILMLPIFAFAVSAQSPLTVIPMCVFVCVSFSINIFAVEEAGSLSQLYLTLPVKRSAIVTGRYALSLLMTTCGITAGIPLMHLVNLFSTSKYYASISWYVFIIAVSYLIYAFLNLFMYPILFRLGYVKGQFWGFYLPLIVFGIIIGLYVMVASRPGNETLLFDILVYASEHMILICGSIALLATVFLVVSYVLSLRFYKNRSF